MKNTKSRKTTRLMKISIALLAAALSLSSCTASNPNSTESIPTSRPDISADKTALIWLTGTDMPYENDLNDYLDSAGYDFHIQFKTIANDLENMFDGSGKLTNNFWTSCYQYNLISELSSGTADIIDTSCWFENSYLSYAEKDLLEPLDSYLESENGQTLYSSFPQDYWQNLTYNGKIYGVDSWLICLQTDIAYQLNNDIVPSDLTADDLGDDCFSALDKIAALCRSTDTVFGIQSLDSISSWTDYDFITNYIYIDENGKAANIYESDFALKLFEKIAEYYNSGQFLNGIDLGSKLPDEVLGETHSTTAAQCKNGFVTSEDFGISTKVGNSKALCLSNSAHTKLSSNVPVTGIYSGSKNKDLAFEALSAFMCDSEFINILNYGAGYTNTDGCASYAEYSGMPMGNVTKMLPIGGLSPADMGEKMLSALDCKQVSPYSQFSFHTDNVRQQILDIYDLTLNINDNFLKSKTDGASATINAKEYLDQLNKSLYDAGLQDILDEANKQLEEYNETH
ncbi:DUF3502 domain-containing protein [Ruminococcus sp.]|uniref:DUF3502 domain-containing protein n=1 Tax=Ruminococcus sp. TaxID=41978 RepID=UPI0025FA4E9B|nr:DUF3502 domain-containing protein [Ruminococcus sp.]